MGSEPNRFLHQQQAPGPLFKRLSNCFKGFSCFRKQKGGGKRIVPATRITDGSNNHPNRPVLVGIPNQTTNGINPSLYAPPSSPASFAHSTLPSTAPSPINFLASPPGGPQSTMYATGPYANETQLVSPPPAFSTFTTEPSTAPLTPPPEMAHLTTPSSPDVPYAHFLSSSRKGGPESVRALKSGQDSNFFHPETFAQFYLDQSQSGGRLSISKEGDAYSNGGGNRQSKVVKADVEELEAYRASFGFSADDIVTTAQYVEISDVMDSSFTLAANNKSEHIPSPDSHKALEGRVPHKRIGDVSGRSLSSTHILNRDDDEDVFSKMEAPRVGRKVHVGTSNSDCEVDYRRGRSLREEWRNS